MAGDVGQEHPKAAREVRNGFLRRVLVTMTTQPWRRDETPVLARTSKWLTTLKGTGWVIRAASARNFIVWRSRVMHGDTAGVIVLPAPQHVPMTAEERTTLVVDMLSTDFETVDLLPLIEEIGDSEAFSQTFRSAEWRLQSSLCTVWQLEGQGNTVPDWFEGRPTLRLPE